jgi:mono/diheme cytochrome c family protein
MKRIHYGLGSLVLAAVVFQVGCAQTPPSALQGSADDAQAVNTAAWPIPGNHSGPAMNGATVPLGTMGNPIPGMTQADLARFAHGKQIFEQPRSLKVGNFANDVSCVACHGDGGTLGGSPKFAQNMFALADPNSEAGLLAGAPLGMLGFSGHILGNPTLQPLPTAPPGTTLVVSKRLSSQVGGDGYLMAIPEAQLVAREAGQNHALGISGRVARGTDFITGLPFVGRIGWKARTATLAGFNAGATVNEIGLSNPDLPFHQGPDGGLIPEAGFPANPVTDLTRQEKDNLDMFTALSVGPAPAYTDRAGYAAFKKAGCAECHWDGYTTTTNVNDLPNELKPFIAQLGGGKRVPAYTDLLVHNMGVGQLEMSVDDAFGLPILSNVKGAGMADGLNETAASDEYRTAPLWGLRHRSKFMHNGAASTIDEAVRLHYYVSPTGNPAYNSEANEVVNNYLGKNYGKKGNLSPWERASLSKFLRSL